MNILQGVLISGSPLWILWPFNGLYKDSDIIEVLPQVARKYLVEGRITAHTRVPFEPKPEETVTTNTINESLANEITTEENSSSQLPAKSMAGLWPLHLSRALL